MKTCGATTGEGNIGIGPRALYRVTTGTNSIAIGREALKGNDGNNVISNCICIGTAAGKDMRQTITSNTLIGAFSGPNIDVFSPGGYLSGDEALSDVASGDRANLYATGNKNTCVGAFAGCRNGKGSMNTCIGYLSNFATSGGNASAVDKQLAIGYNVRTTATTSIALGYQLVGGSSGTIRIGTGDGGTNFTDNYIELNFLIHLLLGLKHQMKE